MKIVMFSATFLLVLLFLGIFKYLPEWNKQFQKIVTSVIVIFMMLAFTCMILLIAWCVNGRNLNQRFHMRQLHFGKVFKILNRSHFAERGIRFEVGKFGAFIKIKVDRYKGMREMAGELLVDDQEPLDHKSSRVRELIYDELAKSETESTYKKVLSVSEIDQDFAEAEGRSEILANTLNISQPLHSMFGDEDSTPLKKGKQSNLAANFLKQNMFTTELDNEELRKNVLGAIVLTDDEDDEADFEQPQVSPSKNGSLPLKYSHADLDSSAIIKREQDKLVYANSLEERKTPAKPDSLSDDQSPVLPQDQLGPSALLTVSAVCNDTPGEIERADDEFRSVIEHSQFEVPQPVSVRSPLDQELEDAEFFSAVEASTQKSTLH